MSEYPELIKNDEMYTPATALDCIVPFMNKSWTWWECCPGKEHMTNALYERGISLTYSLGKNCLTYKPESYDAIITNPPWSTTLRLSIIEMAIKTQKPFIFLFRLEHMGGIGMTELVKNLDDICLIIPKKRINYIKPFIEGQNAVSRSPFHSVYLTSGLGIGKQILYVD
jgi:hypothetical protein